MRKIILLVVFVSLIFFNFSRPVYAGGCIEGSDGVSYDCSCLANDPITGACDYWDCHIGDCCTYNNTCPAPSSFLPGTLVKSSTGEKKIEDIKIGDKITSFENGKVTESRVNQIYERKRDFYYSLAALLLARPYWEKYL